MITIIHSRIIRTILIGLLLGLLSACGNKGDLKRPGSDAAEQDTVSARPVMGTDSHA